MAKKKEKLVNIWQYLIAGVEPQIVQSVTFLLILGVVVCGVVLPAFGLQSDAFVDEVEAFLDFGRDWRWSWKMFTVDTETLFIGLVLNIDDLTIGRLVAVRSLLNESSSWVVIVAIFKVTAFFGQDVVSSLIALNSICIVSSSRSQSLLLLTHLVL